MALCHLHYRWHRRLWLSLKILSAWLWAYPWWDSKPPAVLGVDFLVLAEILFVREEPQFQWVFQLDQLLGVLQLLFLFCLGQKLTLHFVWKVVVVNYLLEFSKEFQCYDDIRSSTIQFALCYLLLLHNQILNFLVLFWPFPQFFCWSWGSLKFPCLSIQYGLNGGLHASITNWGVQNFS